MSDGFEFTDADPETVLVIRSVLPVFTNDLERPERTGTCVLARIDGHAFGVTAAHVVHEPQQVFGEFTFAVGGQLLRIRTNRFVTPPNDSADIGLISIPSEAAKTINDTGGVFLDAEMIDEVEKADGLDDLNTFANCYFAVGFPASRARSQIRHREKKIHLRTFSVRLTLAPTVDYPDGFSKDEHLLLDYAADEVLLGGQPVNPPKVQGMSGGGIFRFRRRRPETTKLVGILIEHHKAARVMVGTRVAVVAALAREVITRHPNTFL